MSGTKFSVGQYRVDAGSNSIECGGVVLRMSPRSMNVLVYLAARPGESVTHEELLAKFWRGSISSPNAVHKVIAELRHAFGNGGSETAYIETIPKRGYRLIATVSPAPSAEPLTSAHIDADRTPAPSGIHAVIRALVSRAREYSTVAALALVCLVGALVVIVRPPSRDIEAVESKGAPAATTKSVAVLRFRSVDGREDSVRLAEAIAAAVSGSLGQISGLQVVEPAKSFAYSLADTSLAAVGASLQADRVLDGAVQWLGDHYHVSISLLRVTDGKLLYAYDRDESPDDATAVLQNKVAAAVLGDLSVLLDDEKLKSMEFWGTTNLAAWRLAVEGYVAADNEPDPQRAIGLFRRATELDAGFVSAYGNIVALLETQARLAPTLDRSTMLKEIAGVRARVIQVDSKAEDLRDISMSQAWIENAPLVDREARVRRYLQTAGRDEPCSCYADYARLLFSARLFPEADAFLMKFEIPGGYRWTDNTVLLTLARLGPYLAVPLMKTDLEQFPNDVPMLAWLVPQLARVGEFDDAARYLEHLERSDPVGYWSYSASLELAVLRGELVAGGQPLTRALADPRAGELTRGVINFMLGEVEEGARHWRAMSANERTLAADFGPVFETLFPEALVRDTRYQDLLDELGTGRQWTAYMRQKVVELAPMTQISPASAVPKSSADAT